MAGSRPSGIAIFVLTAFLFQAFAALRTHAGYTLKYEDLVARFISASSNAIPHGRHLQERLDRRLSRAIPNGWQTSLVDEGRKWHLRNKFSSTERIRHYVEQSRSRADFINSGIRTYHGPGRKLLQAAPNTTVPSSFYTQSVYYQGQYTMAISVGTPPQAKIVTMEMSSDLVWLQCANCSLCYTQPNSPFNPSASSSYTPIGCPACSVLGSYAAPCTSTCQYNASYGSSTTSGDYSADVLSILTLSGTPAQLALQFGCGLQNQGSTFITDGVVGLGRGPISLPSQLAPSLNNSQKFSYCLVDRGSNLTVISPIIFGESAVLFNNVSYTPLLSPNNVTSSFYFVHLIGITVGTTAVSIPASAFEFDATGGGGTILDASTTITYLKPEAFTPVASAFIAQFPYPQIDLSSTVGLPLCFDLAQAPEVTIPTIILHFDNADMNLPWQNYLLVTSDTTGASLYVCLVMDSNSAANILGNFAQQNFQVIIDTGTQQVGFVRAECSGILS